MTAICPGMPSLSTYHNSWPFAAVPLLGATKYWRHRTASTMVDSSLASRLNGQCERDTRREHLAPCSMFHALWFILTSAVINRSLMTLLLCCSKRQLFSPILSGQSVCPRLQRPASSTKTIVAWWSLAGRARRVTSVAIVNLPTPVFLYARNAFARHKTGYIYALMKHCGIFNNAFLVFHLVHSNEHKDCEITN